MSPAAETGSHIFMPLPKAGSGKPPQASNDSISKIPQWAPGHAPAAMTAVGIPPGSGAALSERDRRLAARHEERRRRNLHGPQEGPADKVFQEREQERQAFEREALASKRSVNAERAGSTRNEGGHPRSHGHITSSILQAVVPIPAAGGASLTSALDQKVAEKSSREAKYEEKRRQYLAAQRGSTSGEPRVRFQGNQAQESSVMSGHSPALVASTIREVQQSASDQRQNVDPTELPNAPSPGAKIQWKSGIDEPSGRVEQARFPPQEAKRAPSSGPPRPPEQGNLPRRQPNPTMAGVTRPDSDYARHVREQMMADVAAAQRGNDGAHRPGLVAATSPAHQGRILLHAQPVETEDSTTTVSSTIDRKAEYASQLREQMASDEATRKAMKTERKSKFSIVSSAAGPAIGGHEEGLRGGANEWVNKSVRQAKAEYAQQLREQMAAKENAQRAAKGEMENSCSANAGPSWIEGATEGREARRRRSNTEYAEQLRAQIAAQKRINQAQQSLVAARVQPPKDIFEQGGNENYYQQHHQQLLGGVNSFDSRSGEPERHSSQIDDHRSQGRPRTEEKILLSRGEVNNPLATARQERVNHQREYAEALRRDMAAPKVDSLGRPIGDITSPSRTRLRNSNSGTRNTNNNPDFFGQNDGATREASHLQPGLRPQAGERARGWSQQPFEREYLREHATPYSAWPSSRAQSQGRYEVGEHEHSRQPPVPGTHYDAYGSNPKDDPSRGGYDELEYHTGRRGNARWVADGISTSGLPPPRREFADDGERRGERWGTSGSYPERGGGYPVNRSILPEFGGKNARQESLETTNPSVGHGYIRDVHLGPIRDHREQQDHWYFGPRGPPGGAPAVGGGVGVCSTKASKMHNPVDPEELTRIQAKKESYRRDLEAQMAEHTKLQDQRKQGMPGSKEAEVFHLQQAMEERNERNKMAPGYEIGPLGVPVIKDNYSTTGRGQRSPAKKRAVAPAATVNRGLTASAIGLSSTPVGESVPQTNSDLFGSGHDGTSSSLLPPSEGGAGVGDAEGVGAPSRRGSGLRELLGIETNAERDREKSRVQAEALKKQVEDNKVRRDIQKAQLELHERKEELRLQKEREQLHERYEQEGKLAKALKAEKLLKEAEEARLAHAARKEKAAAESREEEKREDARVEREQKELKRKYARERAAEEPLVQASSNPANLPVTEFPTKKGGGTRSPRPIKSPRELEVNEKRHEDSVMMPRLPGRERGTPSIEAQSDNGEQMAEPSKIQTKGPIQRDDPSPHQPPASSRGLATPREGVSIEKLRTELWKQKQLTEVLRHEVGQQEAEKRKLIDIARVAKESEAAALRAAYERRASKHPPAKELGIAGGAGEGNELWRVPPPPSVEGVEGEGRTPSPSDRRRAESTGAAKNAYVANRKLDMDETAEDRLLLAGLRRLSDGNRAPGGGCDTDRLRKDDLGGDSTFREQVPGARAWSSGAASNSRDGRDSKGRPLDYGAVSPGGIRAESRYVFPDGSVRRRLETPAAEGGVGDGGGGGGVPMPLVGTSRIASADLSFALGIDSLRRGGNGAAGDDVEKASGRRRGTGRIGSRDNEDREHRGSGAAPGAEWAPVGRPPRAFVPFLNLPVSNGKANGNNSKERRWASRGSDGSDSPSFLPPVYSAAVNGRSKRRGRPLAGIGGVLLSPGRAMLTGPGRPGTGATSSERPAYGAAGSGHHRRRQSRRRACREGADRGSTTIGDDELSDDCDSVGSGSTDVEFLRRRAEAKLKSLDRQEAAEKAKAEEELNLLVASSPARGTTDATTPEAPAMHSRAVGGVRAAAPTHNTARRTISAASSSSSRSLMYSRRKKRPGTNKSESSMLGDSRWAEQL
ncbi:unnamed protein product [Ectocarpus sp. 4 AP-2014]